MDRACSLDSDSRGRRCDGAAIGIASGGPERCGTGRRGSTARARASISATTSITKTRWPHSARPSTLIRPILPPIGSSPRRCGSAHSFVRARSRRRTISARRDRTSRGSLSPRVSIPRFTPTSIARSRSLNSGSATILTIRTRIFRSARRHAFLTTYKATVEGRVAGGFRTARRAYNEHERALTLDPGRHDAGLTVGLYRYGVSTLSAPLRLLAGLVGFGGGRERGLHLVKRRPPTPAMSRPMPASR